MTYNNGDIYEGFWQKSNYNTLIFVKLIYLKGKCHGKGEKIY